MSQMNQTIAQYSRESIASLTVDKKKELVRLIEMAERKRARDGLTSRGIHWNQFIPHAPTEKQQVALALDDVLELFYGGAAGGGKTDYLLAAALQYVDVPGYAALLIMRTFKDLSQRKAALDRAREWLQGTAARWSAETKTWWFPSGASLTFGYLQDENDKYNYKTAEFQFIGFDELTQFSETQYTYLFTRLRRLKGQEIPLRMRSASNPDGDGVDWVKERFIPDEYIESKDSDKFDRVWTKGQTRFVPARLEDNDHIDQEEYEESLSRLDVVTHARVRDGDWVAVPLGDLIKSEWFGPDKYFPHLPVGARWKSRAWDLAVVDKQIVSDPKKKHRKLPDFHASCVGCVYEDTLWLGRPMIWRGQWSDAVTVIMSTMLEERTITHGTGKALHETAAAQSLIKKGMGLMQYDEHKDKVSRALPWINQAAIGRVKLVGTVKEWEPFTHWWWRFFNPNMYDDSVDAVTGVSEMLGLVFANLVKSAHKEPEQGYQDAELRQAYRRG